MDEMDAEFKELIAVAKEADRITFTQFIAFSNITADSFINLTCFGFKTKARLTEMRNIEGNK
jgi:hypothetical protein